MKVKVKRLTDERKRKLENDSLKAFKPEGETEPKTDVYAISTPLEISLGKEYLGHKDISLLFDRFVAGISRVIALKRLKEISASEILIPIGIDPISGEVSVVQIVHNEKEFFKGKTYDVSVNCYITSMSLEGYCDVDRSYMYCRLHDLASMIEINYDDTMTFSSNNLEGLIDNKKLSLTDIVSISRYEDETEVKITCYIVTKNNDDRIGAKKITITFAKDDINYRCAKVSKFTSTTTDYLSYTKDAFYNELISSDCTVFKLK